MGIDSILSMENDMQMLIWIKHQTQYEFFATTIENVAFFIDLQKNVFKTFTYYTREKERTETHCSVVFNPMTKVSVA